MSILSVVIKAVNRLPLKTTEGDKEEGATVSTAAVKEINMDAAIMAVFLMAFLDGKDHCGSSWDANLMSPLAPIRIKSNLLII